MKPSGIKFVDGYPFEGIFAYIYYREFPSVEKNYRLPEGLAAHWIHKEGSEYFIAVPAELAKATIELNADEATEGDAWDKCPVKEDSLKTFYGCVADILEDEQRQQGFCYSEIANAFEAWLRVDEPCFYLFTVGDGVITPPLSGERIISGGQYTNEDGVDEFEIHYSNLEYDELSALLEQVTSYHVADLKMCQLAYAKVHDANGMICEPVFAEAERVIKEYTDTLQSIVDEYVASDRNNNYGYKYDLCLFVDDKKINMAQRIINSTEQFHKSEIRISAPLPFGSVVFLQNLKNRWPSCNKKEVGILKGIG